MVFLTLDESGLVWCYSFGFLFGIAQAFIGLFGIILLFQDYRGLADQCKNASTINSNDREGS
jgi:hypothetical protein